MNRSQYIYETNIALLNSIIDRGKNANSIRLSTLEMKVLSTAIDHNREKLNGGK